MDQNYNAAIQSITNSIDNNQEPNRKNRQGSPYRQMLAALVAQLGTINTGMAFGFPAIALPQLKDGNGTININLNEASWIGINIF
jgi:facilitated trehalose transporter